MKLGDFFTLPAIIMFVLGILLSGWIMAMFHSSKRAVSSP